jgi:hypothetical protein
MFFHLVEAFLRWAGEFAGWLRIDQMCLLKQRTRASCWAKLLVRADVNGLFFFVGRKP